MQSPNACSFASQWNIDLTIMTPKEKNHTSSCVFLKKFAGIGHLDCFEFNSIALIGAL